MVGETSVGQEGPVGGRTRRWHWVHLAFSLLLLAFVSTNLWLGSRDDRRVDALRADLTTTFAETRRADVLAGASQPVGDGQRRLAIPSKADLASAGGVTPDLITADVRMVQARYVVGSIRGSRCVVATWSDDGFAVADGTDSQCSSGTLTLS